MKHPSLSKVSVVCISAFVAMGFTTTLAQTQYGQGLLTIAPSVDAKFKKYMQLSEPLAFAVSTDGSFSSGSFCQQPGTCADINGPQIALERCYADTTTGAPCKLLAIGRDIVWQGRINLKSEIGTGPLSLSPAAEQKLQKYLGLAEPMAFSVSIDGIRSSGSFCQQPGTCQDIDGPGLALERCHATAAPKDPPCKIFALKQNIVWDGPVTLSDSQNKPQSQLQPWLQDVIAPPPAATPPQVAPPVQAAPPAQAAVPEPAPTVPSRVRSSKAFRDLEEEIRNSKTPPQAQ